jgi:NAD+-dependent protein deacetylase SIR2
MTVTLDLENYAMDMPTRRALASLSYSVAKCKKIVVVTGAGISCSCGIPVRPHSSCCIQTYIKYPFSQDFRSSDGLYNLVKQQYPDVVMKGRDLFDASLFRDSTSTAVFYTFISQLKQSIDKAEPSPTHRFIKALDSKNKLLRSYTQNIDGLEERVGLMGSSSREVKAAGKGKGKASLIAKDVRNVQLHGDIHRVRCTLCSADLPCTAEYMQSFDDGVAPECPDCLTRCILSLASSYVFAC